MTTTRHIVATVENFGHALATSVNRHVVHFEYAFGSLVRTPATLARIEHMLTTGKPLRN